MLCFDVTHQKGNYPIYIGCHLLADGNLFPIPNGGKCLIISNPTIAQNYLPSLIESLQNRNIVVDYHLIPDGEEFKNLSTTEELYGVLLEKKIARDNWIIALGGGVIGDIAGFVASTYQRGIKFIQVPTTLLAQVDASVGGKVAVNHALGKNMIGAFYAPQAVIIDLTTLNTLPDREFYAGLAEVIKYGLALDLEFFNWLKLNLNKILQRDFTTLSKMVEWCCKIKAQVVMQDEMEQGSRAILNFGHTFAHALEQYLGYGKWLHGEAVAVGMRIASELSVQLGTLSISELAELKNLLTSAKLPINIPASMPAEAFWQIMSLDKKVTAGEIRFILLNALGESYINAGISKEQVLQALRASYQ